MKFKGDIIITDPCYIMRKDDNYKDYSTKPQWDVFITADCEKEPELWQAQYQLYDAASDQWRKENMDDWERCDYGDNMEALGITTYLCRDTIYGDWSCGTYNTDTKEKLGSFCADAGLVAVFLLEEVLKYNPDFDYHTERTWTTTLIKDFDGEISIDVVEVKPPDDIDEEDLEYFEDQEVRVIGTGNINFFTTQTGL